MKSNGNFGSKRPLNWRGDQVVQPVVKSQSHTEMVEQHHRMGTPITRRGGFQGYPSALQPNPYVPEVNPELILKAEEMVGIRHRFAPGDVVNFKSGRKRYLVTKIDKKNDMHLVALSGDPKDAVKNTRDTGAGKIQLHANQDIGFSGKHSNSLRGEARRAIANEYKGYFAADHKNYEKVALDHAEDIIRRWQVGLRDAGDNNLDLRSGDDKPKTLARDESKKPEPTKPTKKSPKYEAGKRYRLKSGEVVTLGTMVDMNTETGRIAAGAWANKEGTEPVIVTKVWGAPGKEKAEVHTFDGESHVVHAGKISRPSKESAAKPHPERYPSPYELGRTSSGRRVLHGTDAHGAEDYARVMVKEGATSKDLDEAASMFKEHAKTFKDSFKRDEQKKVAQTFHRWSVKQEIAEAHKAGKAPSARALQTGPRGGKFYMYAGNKHYVEDEGAPRTKPAKAKAKPKSSGSSMSHTGGGHVSYEYTKSATRQAIDILKAKYTKRTGSPGNYKYEYGEGGGAGKKPYAAPEIGEGIDGSGNKLFVLQGTTPSGESYSHQFKSRAEAESWANTVPKPKGGGKTVKAEQLKSGNIVRMKNAANEPQGYLRISSVGRSSNPEMVQISGQWKGAPGTGEGRHHGDFGRTVTLPFERGEKWELVSHSDTKKSTTRQAIDLLKAMAAPNVPLRPEQQAQGPMLAQPKTPGVDPMAPPPASMQQSPQDQSMGVTPSGQQVHADPFHPEHQGFDKPDHAAAAAQQDQQGNPQAAQIHEQMGQDAQSPMDRATDKFGGPQEQPQSGQPEGGRTEMPGTQITLNPQAGQPQAMPNPLMPGMAPPGMQQPPGMNPYGMQQQPPGQMSPFGMQQPPPGMPGQMPPPGMPGQMPPPGMPGQMPPPGMPQPGVPPMSVMPQQPMPPGMMPMPPSPMDQTPPMQRPGMMKPGNGTPQGEPPMGVQEPNGAPPDGNEEEPDQGKPQAPPQMGSERDGPQPGMVQQIPTGPNGDAATFPPGSQEPPPGSSSVQGPNGMPRPTKAVGPQAPFTNAASQNTPIERMPPR